MNGATHKRIRIPFVPQDYQKESLLHPARFKIVVRGRRGGKTEEELQGAIKDTITKPGLHWIVGPNYKQIKNIAWTRLKSILRVDPAWKINEAELYAEYPDLLDEKGIPTRLELKGSDNEDSLVGVGLKTLRVDEAALVKKNVWENILRPMLADHQAPAYFYTTPRGHNWLHDLFLKGMDPDEPEWQSWRQPTAVNKYINAGEIETMRKEMSHNLFLQEVMAEFLADEAGVFKHIRQCIVGELEAPIEGHFYVMGVDLAKTQDFTVLTVMDTTTRKVVAFERFQDLLWTVQKERIQTLAHKYNDALTILDATGVGDPIAEDLQYSNVSLYYEGDKPGIRFNNQNKKQMIDNLAISLEQRLITMPHIDVLVSELNDFGYEITNKGNITYGAPEGKHDDCVISLALANWGIRHYLRSAQVVQGQMKEELIQDKQGHGELVTNVEVQRPWR